MKKYIKKHTSIVGIAMFVLSIGGCGTLTGATLGGAAGASIGAATHSNVGRSAAIGAGVGGTAGAIYDVFGCCGRRYDHDDYSD